MASSNIESILQTLDDYEQSPESRGVQLRLDLSKIVIQQLKFMGWSQRDLARKAGMKEPYISRILHSDANWTADSAGRILFALGIEATLVPLIEWSTIWQDYVHGEEIEGRTEQDLTLAFVTETSQGGYVQTAEAAGPVAEVCVG